MSQLLFLDTFSHEEVDLNLDLVQFPSFVVVEEVRVIPLGGKVHVNFPGGKANMRLGATLPNKFTLEFFVNDLMKPTASTFSSLGVLDYDNHGQIGLTITNNKRIPTDGLVLRGHYNAVTLAVYGTFTPTTAEQLALLSASSVTEPEKIEANPDPPTLTSSSRAQQGHPIPIAHSPHKRNDWTSSWPPPVQDNLNDENYSVSNSRNDWSVENGQRSHKEEYYDHHHHRHQSRHRSPSHRENRSLTRSPSRRHTSRRSVTPKSPPLPPPPSNNGYASPEQKKSVAKIEPVATSEEAPILDDVSDISDGDIPDDELSLKEEVPEAAEPMNEEDAFPDANMDDLQDQEVKADSEVAIKLSKEPMIQIPEDIEEISDEEADWSDDGDCFFLDSLVEVEFDSDWVDPFTPFKTENASLGDLKVFKLNGSDLSDHGGSIEILQKLASLEVGSDWVETLECLETSSLQPSSSLLPIISLGLSINEAMKHSVHTMKVRHLKAGIRFTTEALDRITDTRDLKNIVALLMQLIFEDKMADPLRVQCLLAVNRAMDQVNGLNLFVGSQWPSKITEFMASSGKKLTTRLKVGLANILERISLAEAVGTLDDKVLDAEERLDLLRQIVQMIQMEGVPKLSFLSDKKCGVVPFVLRDLYNSGFCEKLVYWHEAMRIDQKYCESAFSLLEETLTEVIQKPSGLLLLASCPKDMDRLLAKAPLDFVHYSLHAVGQLDVLSLCCKSAKYQRGKLEIPAVLEAIKNLYGMTCSTIGRQAVIHVLSMGEFLKPILLLTKHSGELDDEKQEKRDLKKSAIRGYACEILLMVVRMSDEVEYLYHFGPELLTLGKSDENSKLFELTSWLQQVMGSQTIHWSLQTRSRPKVRFEYLNYIILLFSMTFFFRWS